MNTTNQQRHIPSNTPLRLKSVLLSFYVLFFSPFDSSQILFYPSDRLVLVLLVH